MNIGKYIQLYSEDLKLKNYAKSSIENYCSQVALFLSDHEKVATKPSEISERQIKEWLLKANSINSMKHRISAVKLFYKLTGKQPLKFKYIEYPKSDKKLPIVLSVEEIQGMFNACENLKHRVILGLLYSCGLRVRKLILYLYCISVIKIFTKSPCYYSLPMCFRTTGMPLSFDGAFLWKKL